MSEILEQTMAQYDEIADLYDAGNDRIGPFRRHVEEHTFWNIAGSVDGLTVFDVACGDGAYSRALAERGAKVVAMDQSAEMIRIAQQVEKEQELGIEYLVQDATELASVGQFDLVTAIYLLHYAPSEEALESMCRGLRANVKDGGRLITLAFNPEIDPARADMTKYGFRLKLPELEDGAECSIEVLLDPPFGFSFFYWSKDVHVRALENAGFKNVVWHNSICSPEGLAEYPAGFWDGYLHNPHAVFISCEV
ncbi:class I SAM-dependent methyltransferase [Acrocarpospora catenulata]|uniref:class I SAM-dependent methyltransferase n=1 Tax=Acrocarpospora catenulata TaxID=2836182 RepID=UPI001BD9C4C5|nr:class I SAM-dependent methyltransferase [Acrocarpospora catenulata]